MNAKTYVCWHGEATDSDDERIDREEVRAYSPERAAESYAIRYDEGDDYDIVFVQDGDLVLEFKCRYRRETHCDATRSRVHS